MIRPLVPSYSRHLRIVSPAASEYDWALVNDLLDTLRDHEGLGLAAPQIGINTQVAVIEIEGLHLVMVNPMVFYRSEETTAEKEGCLSLPGVQVVVERPVSITIDARDERGPYHTGLSGLAARVALHEIDHLQGILITDYAQR